MAIADILNADLATIGRQLRAGSDWWVAELAAMLPSRRRGGVVAELHGAEAAYFRDGRRLSAVPARTKAMLSLPPAQALLREVMLPRLPKRDTRRLLALDLDRLTPLDPATALFDFEPAEDVAPLGRQIVRLGVVRRTSVERALAHAAQLGIEPAAVGVAEGDGLARFDFLPQLRAEQGMGPLWADPRAWWIGAGALVLANISAATYLDAADVGALTDMVAAQQDAVQLAQRLRGRVRAEDARRAAQVARRDTQEPLRVLTAATAAIPAPAWVQRATWTGSALRLVGFTVDGLDVETALRHAPAFGVVHATSSDIAPTDPRYQAFDISAEPRVVAPPAPRIAGR